VEEEQQQTAVEGAPEPESEVHVIEDSDAEQERKRELEERIRGLPEQDPEAEQPATRGGGSPATMVAEARKHIGYRESGDNDTKFNRWLGSIPGYPHGGFGYPWCHSFVSYCLSNSGNGAAGPRTAGCEAGVGWFKSRGRYHSTPKAGDLVYYGAGGGTHVELVVGVGPTTIQTIGGNTSGSLGGNYFNGNGVYEKTVSRSSSRIHGYGRPAYGSGGGGGGGGTAVKAMTSIRTVKQQQEAVNALGHTPKLDVDNEWGPKTEAGVKWLQKKVGTTPDGEWGKNTEEKYVAFTKSK
jgi:CHAP domain/Putative peptidoglycan binding domain